LTDTLIEEREIGRMEDAVAETGERGTQHQPGIAGRHTQHDAGQREHANAEAEDEPPAHTIDDETRKRLSNAADHEERRREKSDIGVAEREIAHQPREQRRQHQMEEVRGPVCEPDERDDLAVSGYSWCIGWLHSADSGGVERSLRSVSDCARTIPERYLTEVVSSVLRSPT
jgi:hypothetical protein